MKITPFDEITRIDSARTIAGRGVYWWTAYLVGGLLVDTGCAHSAGELVQVLEGENLNTIINTHSHEDHIGANGILQNQRSIQVYAHPSALSVLTFPREAQPLQMYRRVFWGWPTESTAQPLKDGEVIETSDFRFQVTYTPGHSPDHICLYEPVRGWLFTGDLFVGGRDRAVRSDTDIWQIIASLKRVAALPLKVMFPGCARIRTNPVEALKTKIAYLEHIGKKVLELHNTGASVGEIARGLFGGPMWIEWVTLGHFSRRRLVRSYLNQKDPGAERFLGS